MQVDEAVHVSLAHGARWRRGCVQALIALGLDPRRRAVAELAVHEALCNALEHGHRGDTAVPIALRVTRRSVDELVVEVVDAALGGVWSPFSVGPGRAPSDGVPTRRGHGLQLMRSGCDELRITAEPGATRVAMAFDIRPGPWERTGANARFVVDGVTS